MGKIYRRDTLLSGVRPKSRKDEKRRKRSVIINFRVSPEEKRLIDNRIALSGLKKSDFFIQSCMHQKIVTFGNVKTFDEIRDKLQHVEQHLSEIRKSEELDMEMMESLRMILEMLDSLYRGGGGESDWHKGSMTGFD